MHTLPKLRNYWDYEILALAEAVVLTQIDKGDGEYVVWNYDDVGNCSSGFYSFSEEPGEAEFIRRAFPWASDTIAPKGEYINSGGLTCYYCGDNDIDSTEIPHFEGLEIRQEVHCLKCGKVWTDIYKLDDIEYIGEEDETT